MKWKSVTKPFKKLLVSQGGSTAGRNSAGRITIYHRGGGAKRLQRNIDLKRSTSSMGVVERIEYDPNRSSRLALVRWIEGVHPDTQRHYDKDFTPEKGTEPITTAVAGQFPLACLAPGLMGGNVGKKAGGKISSVKDVFVSAFASKRAKAESLSNIPGAAVAGAKPAVFAPKSREQISEGENEISLSDVQRWRKGSCLWDHKLKRKAAVPWLSFVNEEPVGLAIAAQNDKSARSAGKSSKGATHVVDHAPFTYIIASDKLEEGKIVMNYDWSKGPSRR